MLVQSGIPVAEQSISFEGRDLSNPKATMQECGIGDSAMLLIRRKVMVAGRLVLSLHNQLLPPEPNYAHSRIYAGKPSRTPR